jgi:hypothetical protein
MQVTTSPGLAYLHTPAPPQLVLCPRYVRGEAPHGCGGVAGQTGWDGSVYVCTFCVDAQPKPARQEQPDATHP